MGFLDDLKRQADAAKAEQAGDTRALARNAALADTACKTAFKYFTTLAQQLNVLRPTSKVGYRLDRRHVFDALALGDFRADARRKRLRDEEVFDHTVLRWSMTSGRKLTLVKNFLPDIEQLESRLRRSGAQVDAEAVRHPDTAKLQEMLYAFVADFTGEAVVTPDHDRATVRVELSNLDGFETVSAEFPAFDFGSARLDEFARWLLGEPNLFLDGAQHLRRVEA